MALTAQQQRFVDEYLIDLNATQAAIRAGYSANSAAMQASRLLSKDNISEAVARAQQARAKKAGISQDRVIEELARIGFAETDEPVKWADKRAALEALLKHLGGTTTEEARSLTINIKTSEPVGEIRVTRPDT